MVPPLIPCRITRAASKAAKALTTLAATSLDLADHPTSPHHQYHHARSLADAGRPHDARELLATVLASPLTPDRIRTAALTLLHRLPRPR